MTLLTPTTPPMLTPDAMSAINGLFLLWLLLMVGVAYLTLAPARRGRR